MTGNRVVYCPTCEREVVLRRKNFDHIYHEILCFMILFTAGIGIVIYFILLFSKRKDRCPNCERQFNIKNLPKKP